jgi:TonB-linked SusC/RagA family outer membrane protein
MMKNYLRRKLLVLAFMVPISFLMAQDVRVSGTVTDASSGEPLPGVTVLVKGTTNGTITGINGEYELSVPAGSTIVFTSIGFASQEVAASEAGNISMRTDVTNLDEVVVTGLASSVKRSNLANAVTTVSGDQLSGTTKAQSVDQALFGKIPGANIKISSGAPGGGTSVQLRGLSTISNGNSQPLYIIDGVYVNNNSISTGISALNQAGTGTGQGLQDDISNRLSDINPDDIASIEVLKGPSAAAIYGTRANAGVIIINTKRGKEGETKVRFTQEFGYNQALNLLGSASWTQAKIDTLFGGSQLRTDLFNTGRNIDWEEEIYGEKGAITNTAISVSGGNAKTKFFISAGSRSEDGIIKNTGFERNSVRLNLDHKLSDRIELTSQSNYINSISDRGFTGNQNNTGASLGYTLAFAPPYADYFPDENGVYPSNPFFSENPIALRDLGTNRNTVNRFIQSFSVNYNIIQTDDSFLKFQAQGGVDYTSGSSLVHLPENLQFQSNAANPGDVMQGRYNQINTNLQFFLNYNRNFNDINSNTSIGVVKLSQKSEEALIRGQGLSNGLQRANSATVQSIQREFNTEAVDFGYVIQEELNYRDQIIVTGGIRFDRSTLNLDQEKFYAFPKASAAFNIHNFDFFSVAPVSQFKLRVAYGETGGLPRFGSTFTQLNNVFVGPSSGQTLATTTVDPNLAPETAQEIEFGADFGFMDGRIGLEATYFVKTVQDLIESFVPAGSTGITSILSNVGDLENKGIELSLVGSPIKTDNFEWNAYVNFWTINTELTRFDVPSFTRGGFGAGLGTYEFAEGQSPTTIVGTPELTDADGNGTGRFTVYGDAQPDYQIGIGSNLRIMKNFNVNFLFHHSKGNDVINLTSFLTDLGGTTPDFNGDDDNDGLVNGRDRAPDASAFIEDGTYWKLRELGVYYTVPQSIIDNTFNGFVEGIKIGASGNNLFLWSDYSSYDPEVSQFSQDAVASSVEVTPFPSSRRVMFHINIDF